MLSLIKQLRTEDFWRGMEFKRYGITPVFLMVQSCFGSIAVCYVLELPEDNVQLLLLSVVAISTMAANASIISLMALKWVFRFFLTSIVLSLLSLIYALI